MERLFDRRKDFTTKKLEISVIENLSVRFSFLDCVSDSYIASYSNAAFIFGWGCILAEYKSIWNRIDFQHWKMYCIFTSLHQKVLPGGVIMMSFLEISSRFVIWIDKVIYKNKSQWINTLFELNSFKGYKRKRNLR